MNHVVRVVAIGKAEYGYIHVNDTTALCLPTTDAPGVVATIDIFASLS